MKVHTSVFLIAAIQVDNQLMSPFIQKARRNGSMQRQSPMALFARNMAEARGVLSSRWLCTQATVSVDFG